MWVRAAPLLLGAMTAALIGLVAWGFRRTQESDAASSLRARDDVLLGFMLLAGLALAIFLVYLLLILQSR